MEPTPPFMTIRTRQPANNERAQSSLSISSSSDSAYGSSSESCAPATHDISRVSYHVKHLESFAQALEDSASRAFPNRGPTQRYTKVHALMLHWKSDDLFVLPELEDLEKCFRDYYCFETDIFSIPSENSHLELMLKIGDMVKQYESEQTLFVVYYAGHARIDESRQSTWCANRRHDSPWLQWSAIQTLLERSIADVLILLDCCAGAASATFPTGQSITETISASSWDAIAPDPGRYSFTNTLIEVLDEWRGKTFSAAMLHAEILARLKHPRPILINGKHFEARSTPVHFMMTSNHKAPSIEICRLVPPKAAKARRGLGSSSVPVGRNWHQPFPASMDDMIPMASEPNEDEPHVMISLALEDDQKLDLNAWEEWLAGFPALAKFVKVQGVFKSHSTLLLLSLPVMVWDFLPDDPACSFVAFIRSNNLLRAPKESKPEPTPAEVSVPATTTQEVDPEPSREVEPEPSRNDAESLSGDTLAQTENSESVRHGTSVPNISVNYSRQQHARETLTSPHRADSVPVPSQKTLAAQPSSSSLFASLRNMGSTISLGGHQSRPASLSGAHASAHHGSEPITRTMIINRSKSSKRSIFTPDQEVPEGQQMAKHVVGRLEEYFHRNPDPNLSVIEHLASHFGVETNDIKVWFHNRRQQQQLTQNLQTLRLPTSQPFELLSSVDGPFMILPGHLSRLLEIYPSKGILLVDLRSSTDFERSHIHDALNLRAPLSFITHTSLEMIEDTFMDDQSRRSFSKWSACRCVVFYDRILEFPWECPIASALYQKLRAKGWSGQCFILKGHYREFSASFDRYISGSKMTQEAKEYLDSLRQQPTLTEEQTAERNREYDTWLSSFMSHRPSQSADLIPPRKLERMKEVGQHQKELETEFESRFPALYKKAQMMAPRKPSVAFPASDEGGYSPIAPSVSPPPPFEHSSGGGFKDVEWQKRKGIEEDTEAQFVGPLVRGLEKMREEGFGMMGSQTPSPTSGTPVGDLKGKAMYDYNEFSVGATMGEVGGGGGGYEEYDEIDVVQEGLTTHATAVGGDTKGGGVMGKVVKKRGVVREWLRGGTGNK
ncbi:pah7 homeobox protein encoded by the pah7 protein [Triangularia verruculosa]|uniref:Pah7 homeobox protein encoded by the pah7 protein n=1 Tax=Triangularia verruculosa TaxID=2587418 RepID=A0AAN7AT51_9PEZI|nr:pah7 homeobox protein encoded by the pah7 protein [Triangularia verruculosa]